MVRTIIEIKVKVREWIEQREDPFKTEDVTKYLSGMTNKIRVPSHRIQNYIRATKLVTFDSNKRIWKK